MVDCFYAVTETFRRSSALRDPAAKGHGKFPCGADAARGTTASECQGATAMGESVPRVGIEPTTHGFSVHSPTCHEDDERWLPVVGYEGFYEVSDLGRVKRVAPGRSTRVGRILKGSRSATGYAIVALYAADGRSRTRTVHKLVADAFLPKPALQVDHVNGNRFDARLANLEWVTGKENTRRAIDRAPVFPFPRKPNPRTTPLEPFERVSEEEKAQLRAEGRARWLTERERALTQAVAK